MLKEYIGYLRNIRNILIQGGAEVPLTPIETYRDTFIEGLRLDDVAWFYSVLAIGGSELALSTPLPLNGYYKERMRQSFYKEFLKNREDYLKLNSDYYVGNTGVEESSTKDYDVEDLYEGYDTGYEESVVEPEESVLTEEQVNFSIQDKAVVQESENVSVEYVHGVFIEDIVIPESGDVEDDDEDEGDNIVHGIFIEDISVEVFEDEDNSVELDDCNDGIEPEVIHGTFIEDISLEIEKDTSDKVIHGIFIEDIDVNVIVHEKSSEEVHGVFIEDIVIPEESEEFDEGEYEEIIEDEEYEEQEEQEEYVEENSSEGSFDLHEVQQESVKQVQQEPDLADALTSIVNRTLTKGKRLIYKELKKKR